MKRGGDYTVGGAAGKRKLHNHRVAWKNCGLWQALKKNGLAKVSLNTGGETSLREGEALDRKKGGKAFKGPFQKVADIGLHRVGKTNTTGEDKRKGK